MRKRKMIEYDLDLDDDNSDLESLHEKQDHESDEDTEDASETDMVKQEEDYTEMKEQIYQDKLANLKKQLQQLEDGNYPEFLKRLKKLDQTYNHRLLLNDVYQEVELERVESEFELEKKAAVKEYEEKSIELRENLLTDLDEKRRVIETERHTMELTGDSTDVKPVTTRKLRRRPNDPLPLPEKRRKTSPTQLCYLLEEPEILDDLKIISKGKYQAPTRRHETPDNLTSMEHSSNYVEVRVEDGKLYYDKKWFHRGQHVYYEGKEGGSRNSGVICTISSSELWIKRMADLNKVRIQISQLQKGRYSLRRRNS